MPRWVVRFVLVDRLRANGNGCGRGRGHNVRPPVTRDLRRRRPPLRRPVRYCFLEIAADTPPHLKHGVRAGRLAASAGEAMAYHLGADEDPGRFPTRQASGDHRMVGSQPAVDVTAAAVGLQPLLSEGRGLARAGHARERCRRACERGASFRPNGAIEMPWRCHRCSIGVPSGSSTCTNAPLVPTGRASGR
jgi:hypothetical protein